MWLFPGLYLLETVALPAVVCALTFRGDASRAMAGVTSAGAMAAFSLLGAWSVGLAYAPLAAGLLVTGWVGRASTGDSPAPLVLGFLAAAGIQAGLMLALVRLS
jgi:hypothetical protein